MIGQLKLLDWDSGLIFHFYPSLCYRLIGGYKKLDPPAKSRLGRNNLRSSISTKSSPLQSAQAIYVALGIIVESA